MNGNVFTRESSCAFNKDSCTARIEDPDALHTNVLAIDEFDRFAFRRDLREFPDFAAANDDRCKR